MVFNATFNNISVISWKSVLLEEETEVPGETHTLFKEMFLNDVMHYARCYYTSNWLAKSTGSSVNIGFRINVL